MGTGERRSRAARTGARHATVTDGRGGTNAEPLPAMPGSWQRRVRAVCSSLWSSDAEIGAAPAAAVEPVQQIKITPIVELPDGGEFGARVTGVDVARLDDGQWERVWAAWLKYAVLVFPDQTLTPSEEVGFYQRFPHRDVKAQQSVRRAPIAEAPDIGLVGNSELKDHFGVSGRIAPTGAGFQWHPDGSYDGTAPPAVTQLYCLQVPGVGGGVLRWSSGATAEYEGAATVFADARYADRRRSTADRALADSLTVQYWPNGMFNRGATQPDGEKYPQMADNGLRPLQPPILPDEPPEDAAPPTMSLDEPNLSAFLDQEQKQRNDGGAAVGAAYPVVWRHPDTGVPAIMAHTLVMQHLQQQPPSSTSVPIVWSWEESEAYVASLLEPVTQPPCILIHNWQPKDLVVWVSFACLLSCTGFTVATGHWRVHLSALHFRTHAGGLSVDGRTISAHCTPSLRGKPTQPQEDQGSCTGCHCSVTGIHHDARRMRQVSHGTIYQRVGLCIALLQQAFTNAPQRSVRFVDLSGP